MKSFSKKYIVMMLAAISLLLLTSCEKEIFVDLRTAEPSLVIEGVVEQDSVATIRLTKSKGFNTNNDYPPVEGAVVIVSDNAGNSEQLKFDSESGWYKASALKGVVGRTYTLKVTYEGVEYNATSTMPAYVPIQDVVMYYIPVMGYATPIVKFQDPKGIVNYYNSRVYVNNRRVGLKDAVTEDELRDGTLIARTLPIFEQDNDHKKVEKGDKIRVELITLDEGAHKFFETLSRIEQSETNPTTNITGGALGYFSACTRDEKTITADW